MKIGIKEYFQHNPNCVYILLGFVAVILYELPFIIFGEDSWIRIHDNLDSTVAYMRIMVDSDMIFNYQNKLPMLYGINRTDYNISYTLDWLIFSILPTTYWAIIFNDCLVRLIAFIGMYLLLSQYVCGECKFLSCVISICFSYISFYTLYGLSAAGIPLILYSFLNLKNSVQKELSYCIIILFALYSNLVLSGVFLGIVLFICWIYLVVTQKKMHKEYFVGLCILGCSYLIINFELFMDFGFSQDFTSHRIEFDHISGKEAIIAIKEMFFLTQYHSGELPTTIIIVTILVAIVSQLKISKELLISLVVLFFVFCLSAVGTLLKSCSNIQFFVVFQMDRFYFLLPALWMITFACALKDLMKKNIFIPLAFVVLLFFQICNHNSELKSHKRKIEGKQSFVPTFKQYYDTELFNNIATDICQRRSECKVVCVGLHPAIAMYNGFYTIDGYLYNYQLDYKYEFRKIIADILDEDESLKKYYDGWGGRCYIFLTNGNQLVGKEEHLRTCININVDKLRALGCQYIFSAVILDNYKELGLEFIQDYSLSNSFWNISVYKL